MKHLLALQFLIAALPCAHVLTPNFGRSYGLPQVEPSHRASEVQKRATRSLCAPVVYTGQHRRDSERRHVSWWDTETNATETNLVRRVMTLPGDSMDEFMVDEMDLAISPSHESIIWQAQQQGQWSDMATSLFDEFMDQAMSYGTGFLCGCTTMLLISQKAVYIGHYWENISFSPDPDWLARFKTADNAFEQTVIKGLSQGVGRLNSPEQVSLRWQTPKLDDEHLHGFLMIPSRGPNEKPDPYRNRWNAMKEKVAEFLPKMRDDRRWSEVTYDALDNDDDQLRETARGRILFKYDPNHNGKKKATLWIESQNNPPAYDVEW